MMLGTGQSSHLYCELREKQELVQEIGAFTWSSHTSEGLLGVGAECDPEKRDAVIDAVLEQVKHYTQQDLGTALARANTAQIGLYARGLDEAPATAGKGILT